MRTRRIGYVSLLLILFAACSVVAQDRVRSSFKVRTRGLDLEISFAGKRHLFATRDQTDAAKLTETEILFAIRKGVFRYLLINVIGQSKKVRDDRQCGAGTEANLLWVKVDKTWRLVNKESVRYESCWSPTTSEDDFKIKNKRLTIEIADFRREVDSLVSCDANKPEKGLNIVETPMKKN